MNSFQRPIGEDDLHAYVDGFLDAERRRVVERYLADHPEAAARIAGWQRAGVALREAVAWKAQEPVPAELSVVRLVEARLSRRTARWQPAAAVFLAVAVGAGSGWFARGPGMPRGVDAVSMEAAIAYRVFATDRMHPVEFDAANRVELVAWATRRLGRAVAPPDLSKSGFHLIGGRLIATPQGPGCMFLYGNAQGNRITVFVRPMHKIDVNAPMRPVQAGGTTGFAWARDGLGVSLVASTPLPGLQKLSDQVRDAMSPET
ncbi:MAG TPA: anti-sigma factor [Acetobacteraceae bacterium]|nr:anti-sigma factor [Acetobacteraceae bacterium]